MNRYMAPEYEFSIKEKPGKFTIKKQMGKGNSCMVYLAEFMDPRGNYTEHILKEYNPSDLHVKRNGQGSIFVEKEEQQEFISGMERFARGYRRQAKIRTMVGLKNPTTNIQDIFEAQGTRYIDMTFFEGTVYSSVQEKNLYSLLQRAKALTLILGNYHKAGYLHLDVKPDNIFTIPETCEFVMLYDFDSVMEKEKAHLADNLSCTKAWAAPEQLNPEAFYLLCEATDLFAVGEIVFYQIMGRHSKPEEHRGFSNYEYDVNSPLFKNVNAKIFQKLTEFFHGTIRSSVKQRYQSAKEVAEKIDELLLLANPKEIYLVGTQIPWEEFFVGREKELGLIHESLQKNHILFLSGIGGIGKSLLAKQYARNYKASYDTIAFLTYGGSWIALINDNKNLLIANFERQQEETEEEYCGRKMAKLKEICDERTLLIIDNLNDDEFSDNENELWQELLKLRCRLLFTTRLNSWDYPQMEIQELDTLEKQMKLFQHYCDIEDGEQKKAAEEMIHYVDSHTLIIELIAKQIKAAFSTPVDMLRLLKENGICDSGQEKIKHRKDNIQRTQTLYGHIRMLFDIAELAEDEIYVLTNMALIPVKGVSANSFVQWCELQNFDTVNMLLEKGWIQRQADRLKMHPVISAIGLEVLKEREADCETLLDNLICVDVSALEMEERCLYVETLENIILCLEKNGIEMCELIFLCGILAEELSGFARTKEALRYMEMACDLKKQLLVIEESDEVSLMLNADVGYVHIANGAYKEAEEKYKKILRICRQIHQEETESCAIAYLNLGMLYTSVGRYDKSLKYTNGALKIYKGLPEDFGEEIALAYNNLGLAYIQKDEFKNAERNLLQGVEILEESQQETRTHLYLYRTLGFLYSRTAEYEKAEKYLSRALDVCKKLYGDKHLETIAIYQYFGIMFFEKQQMERAEDNWTHALEICEEIGEQNYQAGILLNLSQALYEKGMLVEAEMKCQEGISVLKSLDKQENVRTALAYEILGNIYNDTEQFDRAKRYGKKALEFYEMVDNKLGKASVYFLFTSISINEGNMEKAEEYLKKRLNICKEMGSMDEEAETCDLLGAFYYDEEKFKKAEKYWKREVMLRKELNDTEENLIAIAETYDDLGMMFREKGDIQRAKKYALKSDSLSEKINKGEGKI